MAIKRGTSNGNRMQVYYMMIEIAVVLFHIYTIATAEFYTFFLATRLRAYTFSTLQLYFY